LHNNYIKPDNTTPADIMGNTIARSPKSTDNDMGTEMCDMLNVLDESDGFLMVYIPTKDEFDMPKSNFTPEEMRIAVAEAEAKDEFVFINSLDASGMCASRPSQMVSRPSQMVSRPLQPMTS